MEREAKRQAVHVVLGGICAAVFYFAPKELSVAAFAAVLVASSAVSLFHKHVRPLTFVREIVMDVERDSEKQFPGIAGLNFMLAVLVTSVLFYNFEPSIGAGALTVLAVGDGLSTLGGAKYGKTRVFGDRTIEGTAVGIIASAACLLLLFPPQTAFIAAAAGMLAEYLPVDDNYTVPVVAGIALAILA